MELLAGASRGFIDAVALVGGDGWDLMSPCEVKVKGVVEHVVAGNLLAVRLITGTTLDLADELAADPVAAVRTSCEAQLTAFARANRDDHLDHCTRKLDPQVFLKTRVRELVVHTWDIAQAAKLEFQLEDWVTEGLWRMLHPNLARLEIQHDDGSTTMPSIPEEWPTLDRVLAALGREPKSTRVRPPTPRPERVAEPTGPNQERVPVDSLPFPRSPADWVLS